MLKLNVFDCLEAFFRSVCQRDCRQTPGQNVPCKLKPHGWFSLLMSPVSLGRERQSHHEHEVHAALSLPTWVDWCWGGVGGEGEGFEEGSVREMGKEVLGWREREEIKIGRAHV